MTGTQKLMITKIFFSYIGKSNKSNIAVWRDLVGPYHVTTFFIPNFVEVGRRPNFVDGMIAYLRSNSLRSNERKLFTA